MPRYAKTALFLVTLLSGCTSSYSQELIAVSASAKTAGELKKALEASVQGKATGTVLIAKGNRILEVRSFSDPAQAGFGPQRTTSYDLASIGKTFTAVLALHLADVGKFDMDAPLRTYLPELPAEMNDITARNALAHDAGLPRYLEGDDLVPRTAQQALAEIAAMKRERKAGTGYYYSNVGPQLVGIALERAGGTTYSGLLQRQMFAPLRMRSTYFHGDPALAKVDVAPAYAGGKRNGSPANWPNTWTMLGAAGIAASIDDLWRFNRGVFTGSFLKPESRTQLLAQGVNTKGRASFRTEDTLDIHYGAGLFHWRDRRGRRVHYHGGASDFGTNTGMLWRQDDDVFVAALFNSTGEDFDRGEFFTAVLNAVDASAEPKAITTQTDPGD